MLTALTIQNIVLIDRLAIEFAAGFCALTGETGAGKSILLDSLGLALGARSEAGLVRRGEAQAQVTAAFELSSDHPAYETLHGSDLVIESGEPLILRRIVKADGGSRAFINDQPVSVGLLKRVGDLLVEIHGQFDTQGLLDPKTHRVLLDDYAAVDTGGLAARWHEWRGAQKTLDEARTAIETARAEEAYLRQALEDLDALAPEPGEEERLAALRARLMKREQIMESLNTAYQGLSEADATIGTVARVLERTGDDGAELRDGLDRTAAELQEVIGGIQALSADLEHSGYALSEIDDRLFALRGQARKHECTADELPAKRDELAAQLNMIEAQDDALADLTRAVETARAAYVAAAETARSARQKAAAKLDRLVGRELPPLKLEKARFVTQVAALDEDGYGPAGMDDVRFLVATNPGRAPGPLHKIASGGEMARFMLALKVVLAGTGTAGSLVFDEVDSGIGGATASAVGERLARLAQDKQILVVTHSPQVAARAAHHWIILKSGDKNDVTTTIIPLAELYERREEIARMLAGAEITGEARAAAERLIETA